ncbi:MAG: 23S rRNA (uracil(1939)-C(5))-methyltransferase RlmD [Pseudanabaenaceae cyanobacterium]
MAILPKSPPVSIEITDLTEHGDGVGRWENLVVFVPGTVPGDRLEVVLTEIKPKFARGKVQRLVTPSPARVRPHCIVADKCGGCDWQALDYGAQLQLKQTQVTQTLQRVGGFAPETLAIAPIVGAAAPYRYRNKATFPLGAGRQGIKAGYYQRGSHRLINLNACPVQDERLDVFLTEIKHDLAQRGWTPYNETTRRGQLRHLSLRVGRRTGQILLTLVATTDRLPGAADQAQAWLDRYPGLRGVLLNCQPEPTNRILGPVTHCLAGQDWIEEHFAGLVLRLRGDAFFQVHTEQAEALVHTLRDRLALQPHETLLDAYAGIGTLVLPLAAHVRQAIALEINPQAVQQGQQNALLNSLTNVTFQGGAVENCLPQLPQIPEVVVLDPPRKGCHPAAIAALRERPPHRLAYIGCHPATLARDLGQLCADARFRLTYVQPFDFFPQTHHVETLALLTHEPNSR